MPGRWAGPFRERKSPAWTARRTCDSTTTGNSFLSLVPEGSFFRIVGEGEGPETVAEVDAAIPYQIIDGFHATVPAQSILTFHIDPLHD